MEVGANPKSQIEEAAMAYAPQRQHAGGIKRFDAQPDGLWGAAAEFLHDYSQSRPEVVALWAFGIGFVLGWKLKPW
jgi:hypothetical protein